MVADMHEAGKPIKVATIQDCMSPPSSLFSRGNQLNHVFNFPTRHDHKLFCNHRSQDSCSRVGGGEIVIGGYSKIYVQINFSDITDLIPQAPHFELGNRSKDCFTAAQARGCYHCELKQSAFVIRSNIHQTRKLTQQCWPIQSNASASRFCD